MTSAKSIRRTWYYLEAILASWTQGGGEEKKYIHPELSRENEKKKKKIAAINLVRSDDGGGMDRSIRGRRYSNKSLAVGTRKM